MLPSCRQDAFALAPAACWASCMSGVRDAFARLPSPFTLRSGHCATALHRPLPVVCPRLMVGRVCNNGASGSHARKRCR